MWQPANLGNLLGNERKVSMLAWVKEDVTWRGNGFRIERRSARTWILLDVASGSTEQHVQVESVPIAIMTTLAGCKHKAEMLHRKAQRSLQRQRLVLVVVGMTLAAMLSFASPIIAICCGVLAGGAALELLMISMGSWFGDAREIVQ